MDGVAASSPPFRVLFVCLGNICRSPMAEAVFRARGAKAGLADRVEVSSAGTAGWHADRPADPRTVAALRRAGYPLDHRARQFVAAWFDQHDLVIALDRANLQDLRALAPDRERADRVRLLRSYDPEAGADLDVPDPYYGDDASFDDVLTQVVAACAGLLAEVRREANIR
jgi:protein-tyrosine phosphatase